MSDAGTVKAPRIDPRSADTRSEPS